MSSSTPKEYTAQELRTMHDEEASQLGWRCVCNAGQVKGDLLVSILPPATRVTNETRARSYLYRFNQLTGKYALVKRET